MSEAMPEKDLPHVVNPDDDNDENRDDNGDLAETPATR